MIGLGKCSLGNSVVLPYLSMYPQVTITETVLYDTPAPVGGPCRTSDNMHLGFISVSLSSPCSVYFSRQ